MGLSVKEKMIWLSSAALFHIAGTIIVTYRMHLSIAIFLLWLLSVFLAYFLLIYVLVIPKIPERLISEGATKSMDAFGVLAGITIGFVVSTHVKLDTTIYWATLMFLNSYFCMLLLVRPVSSDFGIHYTVIGWLVTLTIRDFTYSSNLSGLVVIVGLFQILFRLAVDVITQFLSTTC